MQRPYNFSAGPAMLPTEVLEQAQAELLDFQGSGISPMELGHRSKFFSEIREKTEACLREILAIPNNYKVLFLSGGATSQFAMIPLNLLRNKPSADYIETGIWSKKASKEAKRYCTVNLAGENHNSELLSLPEQAQLTLNPDAAYVYYTDNETIGGMEFKYVPETNGVPLVSDMTSNILSRPIDISRYGLIYASAQKNIGHAGVTIVIVREDLIGEPHPMAPTMFNYLAHAEQDSCLNTPPTYAWYFAGLVFEWVKRQGGLEAMQRQAKLRSEKLYAAIDDSDFYTNNIHPSSRSNMNVPFILADANLDEKFLAESQAAGLWNLKGHRSVGGMRASMYNSMPVAGVDALIDFLNDFQRKYG